MENYAVNKQNLKLKRLIRLFALVLGFNIIIQSSYFNNYTQNNTSQFVLADHLTKCNISKFSNSKDHNLLNSFLKKALLLRYNSKYSAPDVAQFVLKHSENRYLLNYKVANESFKQSKYLLRHSGLSPPIFFI